MLSQRDGVEPAPSVDGRGQAPAVARGVRLLGTGRVVACFSSEVTLATKLVLLHILGPPTMAPIDPGGVAGVIPSAIELRRPDAVRNRVEWDRLLDDEISRSCPEDTRIIVAVGHGERTQRPGAVEPLNLLVTVETDRNALYDTTIDLDSALARIATEGRGRWLLVVDACNVSVRTTRDADSGSSASIAALMAGPRAEAGVNGGLLTQHFIRALTGGHSTLREVLAAACVGVKRDTNGRQAPHFTPVSNAGFLDEPLFAGPPAGLRRAEGKLLGAILELSMNARLGSADLQALANIAVDIGGDLGLELELVLLAAEVLQTRDVTTLKRLDTSNRDSRAEQVDPRAKARALHALGWAALEGVGKDPRPDRAITQLMDALECIGPPGTGDSDSLRAQVLDTLGTARQREGLAETAFKAYTESRDIKEQSGDHRGLEMTRHSLGWALLASGAFEEGEREFRSGVDACLGRLESPSKGTGVGGLVSTVESLFFHMVGLQTAMLIRGAPSPEHGQAWRPVRRWREFAETLPAWGSPIPTALAGMLDAVSTGGLRKYGGASDVGAAGDPIHQAWVLAAQLLEQGQGRMGPLRDHLLTLISDRKPTERVMGLAVASHLHHRFPQPAVAELLAECVKELRLLDRRVDPVTTYPWFLGVQREQLVTDTWSGALFLGAQKAASTGDHVVPHYSVTEQYIQLLALYSGLLICAAARNRVELVKRVHDAIVTRLHGGRPFMLTLREAFELARSVADQASVPGGWGKRLCEAWRKLSVLDGYASPDEFYRERNDTTHREPLRWDRLRDVLKRHEEIIMRSCDLLADAPVPTVDVGRPIDASGTLNSAILQLPGQDKLDCGVLLAVDSGRASTVLVPHTIQRPASAAACSGLSGCEGEYIAYYVGSPPALMLTTKIVVS